MTRFWIFPLSPADVNEQKQQNKLVVQAALDLPLKEKIPVFGFVGRLCYQKGLDIIMEAIDGIVAKEARLFSREWGTKNIIA